MSLTDIKNEIVNEVHNIEQKVESVFDTVKEVPAKVEQHVADALKEAESLPSIGAAELKAETVTVEEAIKTPFESLISELKDKLSSVEADLKALLERVESFNKRSGQKL